MGNRIRRAPATVWRYPVAAAVTTLLLVLILCSGSTSARASPKTLARLGADPALAADLASEDRAVRRRALILLHREARQAIAVLYGLRQDPALRDDAIRVLADIERELARVEGR